MLHNIKQQHPGGTPKYEDEGAPSRSGTCLSPVSRACSTRAPVRLYRTAVSLAESAETGEKWRGGVDPLTTS